MMILARHDGGAQAGHARPTLHLLGAAPRTDGDGAIEDFLDGFQVVNSVNALPAQVRQNVTVIRRFCDSQAIGEITEITPHRVQNWICELLSQGRAPKTVRNAHGSLSRFCRYLVNAGHLDANPCHRVTLPPLEEQVPLFLDEREYEKALRIARKAGIYVEVALALTTGLRSGELRRLEWRDIDLRRRALLVRKSKSKRPRTVCLSRVAIGALLKQRNLTGDCRYVFPGRRRWTKGRFEDCMRGENWWKRDALKPLQEAIPKFQMLPKGSTGRGFHLFRHTFASRLVQRGTPLLKVSAWLGHRTLKMTRRYAHLSPGYDPDIEKV